MLLQRDRRGGSELLHRLDEEEQREEDGREHARLRRYADPRLHCSHDAAGDVVREPRKVDVV